MLSTKLQGAADKYGLVMIDVPHDGDCALHAIIDQLRREEEAYTSTTLRRAAVKHLLANPIDNDFFVHSEFSGFDDYCKQQSALGTWCDEMMIRCVSAALNRQIVIINENGHKINIDLESCHDASHATIQKSPLTLGLMTDYHYVSLYPVGPEVMNSCHATESAQNEHQSGCPDDSWQSLGEQMHEVNGRQTLEHPDCWTFEQWLGFQKEYPWLTCESRSLGCRTCGEVNVISLGGARGVGGHNTLSDEWVNCKVKPYGADRSDQLMSLRKKIWKHKKSAGHNEACKVLLTRAKDELKANVVSQKEEQYHATSNVFRTAYYIAKNNRPYTDHSGLIDLQRLNGVDVGCLLHSSTTCADIVDHIAEHMSSKLMQSVLESDVPFAILIDESTTLSNKACLVVYIIEVLI